MKRLFFIFSILCNVSIVLAQKELTLNGFLKEVSGNSLNYHSPLPNVSKSLLVRSNSDYPQISWEVGKIPSKLNSQDMITFVWMYGVDVNIEKHEYELILNDKKLVKFSNPNDNSSKEYIFKGEEGIKLFFRSTYTDKFGDQMGFAYLTVPAKYIKDNRNIIRIEGDKSGSLSWYMTFKSEINPKIDVFQEPVVLNSSQGLKHVIRFDIVHLQEPCSGVIKVGNEINKNISLKPGLNTVRVELPQVNSKTLVSAHLQSCSFDTLLNFNIQPIKEWTMYLVQHSHTDIGYTRPQTEILAEHLRYIDYALDYCDATDNLPEAAKFRWTCESSWVVNEYLKSRPAQQVERFKKRILEGRIDVTAMSMNYSEIVEESLLVDQLRYLKEIKEQGIPVTTAMQNDVNGIGWSMVDNYQNTGVKYVSMGQHGHRALIPFDKPTVFWWESPAGNKLMAYRAEHYMRANLLGVHLGDLPSFENNVFQYLTDMDRKQYPFNAVSMQFSGYVTDNAPPSTYACELVKRWNEKYEWPKIQLATITEFLKYIEKEYGKDLPTYKVAWPDWWTDGVASAQKECAASRLTSGEMFVNNGLYLMADVNGADIPQEDILEDNKLIKEDLFFYDEHTYSAAESVTDPYCENSIVQWNGKKSYVWDAVKRSRLETEKAMGFMQTYLPKDNVPVITFFNALNWERSAMVKVYIDHQLLPQDKVFKIVDAEGKQALAQPVSGREDGTYWEIWADNVPAMGYKQYRILVENKTRNLVVADGRSDKVENAYYKMVIDTLTGGILSIYDKQLKKELVDKNTQWQFGQMIYEKLSNRVQLEQFKLEHADRTVLQNVKLISIENGPIWKNIRFHADFPVCAKSQGVDVNIRLYHTEKRLEINYVLFKANVEDPEGLYVALPFGLDDAQIQFDVQGGTVVPGKDQLEGTSSDWNTLQSFVSAKNTEMQVVYSSTEIPLVHLGDLNIGKYQYISNPKNPHFYPWILNNYWVTNFLASQEGELRWSCHITSSNDLSNSFASRFGWSNRIPFKVRVTPPSGNMSGKLVKQSFFPELPKNILLVNTILSDDKKGWVLQFRELDGLDTKLSVADFKKALSFNKLIEVNAIQQELNENNNTIELKPYQTKFVKIVFN